MKRANVLIVLAAAFAVVFLVLPQRSSGAGREIAYTGGQVAMGGGIYTQYCLGCHGESLQGNPQSTPPRPPLSGPRFAGDWQGKSAGDLVTFVSKNMPFGRGGTLSRDQYVAVVTYILSQNGVLANGKALDDKALSGIRLNF